MDSLETLGIDLKAAMRAQDKKKLGVLRLITAEIKQVEVDERFVVDNERLISILVKMSKQRKDSIQQFESAGRMDLVEQEKYEIDLINHYLPTPLTEIEITTLIDDAIQHLGASKISDMGKVVNHLKPSIQGRVDMANVSKLIKDRLA